MRFEIENVRKAAKAWFGGCEDDSQEMLLREYVASTPDSDIPDDLKCLSVMFAGFASLAKESVPEIKCGRQRVGIYRWYSAVAAIAAVVIAAVALSARNRQIYGFDYDGSKITSQAKVMESAEYLNCLSLLDENMTFLNDIIE